MKCRTAALLLVALAASCAQRRHYYWGSYDESIAAIYATGTGFDVAAHVDQLAREVEEAEHRGERIGPGIRAHLGFLCIEAGNSARGVTFLEAEKAAFPESATFIDGMLTRLRSRP